MLSGFELGYHRDRRLGDPVLGGLRGYFVVHWISSHCQHAVHPKAQRGSRYVPGTLAGDGGRTMDGAEICWERACHVRNQA